MHSQSDNSAKRGQSLEPPHESGSREDRMEVRPEHCPSEVWLQKTTFQAVKDLVATIRAIPAYRMNLTGDTLTTFKEMTSGSPEAVSRWFYPGHLAGLAFVYPEDQQ